MQNHALNCPFPKNLVIMCHLFTGLTVNLSLCRSCAHTHTHPHSHTHADTQLAIANRIFLQFLWRLKGSFLRLTGTLITPLCVGLVQISTQRHCDVRFFRTGSLHRCCVCSVPVSASAIILRDGDEDRNRSLAL